MRIYKIIVAVFLFTITFVFNAQTGRSCHVFPDTPEPPGNFEVKIISSGTHEGDIQLKWTKPEICSGFEVFRDKYNFKRDGTVEWLVIDWEIPPQNHVSTEITHEDEYGNTDNSHFYYYDTDTSSGGVYSYCVFSWNGYWLNAGEEDEELIAAWSNGTGVKSVTVGTAKAPNNHTISVWAPLAFRFNLNVVTWPFINSILDKDPECYYTIYQDNTEPSSSDDSSSYGTCTVDNLYDVISNGSGYMLVDTEGFHENQDTSFLVLAQAWSVEYGSDWIGENEGLFCIDEIDHYILAANLENEDLVHSNYLSNLWGDYHDENNSIVWLAACDSVDSMDDAGGLTIFGYPGTVDAYDIQADINYIFNAMNDGKSCRKAISAYNHYKDVNHSQWFNSKLEISGGNSTLAPTIISATPTDHGGQSGKITITFDTEMDDTVDLNNAVYCDVFSGSLSVDSGTWENDHVVTFNYSTDGYFFVTICAYGDEFKAKGGQKLDGNGTGANGDNFNWTFRD